MPLLGNLVVSDKGNAGPGDTVAYTIRVVNSIDLTKVDDNYAACLRKQYRECHTTVGIPGPVIDPPGPIVDPPGPVDPVDLFDPADSTTHSVTTVRPTGATLPLTGCDVGLFGGLGTLLLVDGVLLRSRSLRRGSEG